jgi:hypothetical protein
MASSLPRNLLQSENGGEFDTFHSRGPFSSELAFWSSHVKSVLCRGSDFALPVRGKARGTNVAAQRILLELLKLVRFEFGTTFELTKLFLLDSIENFMFRSPDSREVCASNLC